MTNQSTAAKPKTSHLSHQPLPVCAKRKLAGFAEFAQICGTTQMRNRDAFGSPYLANLENDVGFGYTGKIFDSATGLYDYGFRDYAPNSARLSAMPIAARFLLAQKLARLVQGT